MGEVHSTAKVLACCGNDLLLLRRSRRDLYYPGLWDVPGGGIDPGEKRKVAARRELLEEAGLAIAVAGLRHICSSTALSQSRPGVLTTYHYYYAHFRPDEHGNPPLTTLSIEHDEAEWFPCDEARKLLDHPRLRSALSTAIERGFLQLDTGR